MGSAAELPRSNREEPGREPERADEAWVDVPGTTLDVNHQDSGRKVMVLIEDLYVNSQCSRPDVVPAHPAPPRVKRPGYNSHPQCFEIHM